MRNSLLAESKLQRIGIDASRNYHRDPLHHTHLFVLDEYQKIALTLTPHLVFVLEINFPDVIVNLQVQYLILAHSVNYTYTFQFAQR